MDIKIRLEQPADYHEVEMVMREAFWNRYMPGCMEHYLAHIMRRSPDFVHELDFVAEVNDRIIGSVMFMKSFILGDDGCRHETLSMGPIAVLPSFQCKGVGRMLIERARTEATNNGYHAILLCGNLDYYQKVGFVEAEHFGIRTSENKYLAALHICLLRQGASRELSGCYCENDIYYMVNEAEVEAFDRQFPYKEKIADTPSQLRFKEVCAMQKDY